MNGQVADFRHVCFVAASPGPARPGWSASTPPRALPAVPAEPLHPFLGWLTQQAGLQVGAYRPAALNRRLGACLRALRVTSPERARALLESRPELLAKVLDALLIGVSGFFRDEAVFEQLHKVILPGLLRGRPGLRVYSAGCSDGQELYSLAMLLDDLGCLDQSELLGLDCRPVAIARARAGCWPAPEANPVPLAFRARYFHGREGCARVAPRLREKIRWRAGDLLAEPDPDGSWDLVLFRNVAIYMSWEHQALWDRFAALVRPGGVLVTGKAERPPSRLPFRSIGPCLFKKMEGAGLGSPAGTRS